MPNTPKRICPIHHRILEAGQRCPQCQQSRSPDNRPSRSQRGYTRRWYQHYQKPYLAEHPCCEDCEDRGIVKAAECVDHITPHEGDESLLYCWENLRALCWSCHSRKTLREQREKKSRTP